MSAAKDFLSDFQSRRLPDLTSGLKPEKLILGQGRDSLEVAVLTSNNEPNMATIKKAQKKRKNHRAAPVLLTVIHGENQASLCGASGDNPPVYKSIPLSLAEKLCRTALNQPNRHKALKFCSHFLPSIETGLFGLNNRGMLSSHHLIHGVTKRPDWQKAKAQSKKILHFKKEDLLKGLGFHITRLDDLTCILKSKDKKRALAVFLEPLENHESKEQRFNQISPVHYALEKADQENMPWVLMIQDNHIRLYSADKESGVSHSSRSETYIECQPSLLREEDLGYLWLLFSAEALSEQGSLYEILENSKRFSADAAKNLKTRIYDEIVPQIAKGIVYARNLTNPSPEELNETYKMTLTVLFRLLFIAYAEDQDFLPYNTNSAYRKRSLKQKAQELSDLFLKGGELDEGDSHWRETTSLWRAIDKGNPEWGIMAYNGGLFSSERDFSETGFKISKLSISNKLFVPALKSLLLMKTEERPFAPVDFRFMGPKEFGTVYEGLLESNLSIADTDLTWDKKNIYIPVKNLKTNKNKKFKKTEQVCIKKRDVYLHNQSGVRKASGSYYTKSFIVEYILDKSLEPALKEHFKRLNRLSDKEAEKEFFNFFTADIAMGSGHFLVAAVDRIEKKMAEYLDNRPLKGVQDILDKTKTTAQQNLSGISDDYFPVENKKYLARHIARHCIYGVDNNDLAVQLAKLSLWTHTFVPGLPLSYFNHNLICGNSLVGIGTIEEFQSELKSRKESPNLSFDLIDREKLIGQAKKPLQDMKRLSDLSLEEVKQSWKAQKNIKNSLKDTKALFDMMLFNRIKNKGNINKIESWILSWIKNPKSAHRSQDLKTAREELKDLQTLHFPIAFPEVFLRERPGFDVIIGNPPWEKVQQPEKHAFWARYFPGLRGMSQRERELKYKKIEKAYSRLVNQYNSEVLQANKLKNILRKTHFENSGNPDLYKFFSWRFWNLICKNNGFFGVVLKGSIIQAKGTEKFRREIFQKARIHITTFVNNLGWLFDEVDEIRICVLSLERKEIEKEGRGQIDIQGPFKSIKQFNIRKNDNYLSLHKEQILSWTDTASLPSLPTEDALNVFLQLRKSPQLDLNDRRTWRVQADREMNTTEQKSIMDLKSRECPKRFWPVFKGESFNIWQADTGKYYAYISPEKAIDWLYEKRKNGHRYSKSIHFEFSDTYVRSKKTLPCFKPRIAFRDIGSADRPRTLHIGLIPPHVVLVHSANYLLFSRGNERDEAFLLGILSSIPLDWYARRLTSTNHINLSTFNTFPIPRPSRENYLWKRAVALSGRLASPDKRFSKWAKAVGVEYGKLDKEKKNQMIYELDAIAAHLYGLSQKQLIHIFETFHKTRDYYKSRLQAVLKYYNFLKKKHKAAG